MSKSRKLDYSALSLNCPKTLALIDLDRQIEAGLSHQDSGTLALIVSPKPILEWLDECTLLLSLIFDDSVGTAFEGRVRKSRQTPTDKWGPSELRSGVEAALDFLSSLRKQTETLSEPTMRSVGKA